MFHEEIEMSQTKKRLKVSGVVAEHDQFHQVTQSPSIDGPPDEHVVARVTMPVKIVQPQRIGVIGVPQYSATVRGGVAAKYDPAGDCEGNFMSYKFQPNNNCYAYACNIATNTWPQPGRRSGYLLMNPGVFQQPLENIGALFSSYAVHDGLVFVGKTMDDVHRFKSERIKKHDNLDGHFVGLMISPFSGRLNIPEAVSAWTGDYHWCRCDNSAGACDSWSQKDGNDAVTNFDFSGHPITDPSKANWTVNNGPNPKNIREFAELDPEVIVSYGFYCFMFVPMTGVDII